MRFGYRMTGHERYEDTVVELGIASRCQYSNTQL